MSDDRQSDPDVDYAMHTRVHCRADALARLNRLAEQMDDRDTGQTAAGRPRWRAYAMAVLRIALIVVGIPLVWIYRTELDCRPGRQPPPHLSWFSSPPARPSWPRCGAHSARINENHTQARK